MTAGITIAFTVDELAAVDEALAITEPEDRLPSHEAAFAKVRSAFCGDEREGEDG